MTVRGILVHRWLMAIGLVLLVVGAKLWLVDAAGTSVPYRDQIDAEGESILRPWAEGRLEWSAFLQPHNEHRVVFTKALSWLGVTVNQQWDVYPQLCINALLHAGLLLLMLKWLSGYIEGWRYVALAALAVLMWVLPLDWENTLGGFQSQVYLVLGLSFLQIWGVLRTDRQNSAWWGGHLCGLLALGAMASGVLSSIAVVTVLTAKAIRRREVNSLGLKSIGISAVWIVIALFSRVSVEGHRGLAAGSLGDFLSSLTQAASWPLNGLLPWSLVAAVPAIWLAVSILRKRESTAAETVFLGMGVWLLLTLLATAWLRGHGSPLISRYLTTYYLLVGIQGLALVWNSSRAWQHLLFAIWTGSMIAGLVLAAGTALNHRLPDIAERAQSSESIIRQYLATGDGSVLTEAEPGDLPYPSGEVLVERWKHESIRSLMPAAVRRPILPPPAAHSEQSELPPPPYPVIASSPLGGQTESWVWRSQRQPDSALPVLRFRFSGGLGDPEAALRLRIVTDEEDVTIIPDGPARQRWKTINVIRPTGEWWIEIEDSDTVDRLAITAPVELGWMSWGAEKLIKFHFWWLSAGAIAFVIGALDLLRIRALPRYPSPRGEG